MTRFYGWLAAAALLAAGAAWAQDAPPTVRPPMAPDKGPRPTTAGPGMPGGPAPKKAEPRLADLLEEALRHNADIAAADAKVQEAEAELSRIRTRVLNQIVTLRGDIAAAKAAADQAATRYERAKALHQKGALALEELLPAELTLQKFKADHAKVEAELPYLLGRVPAAIADKAPRPGANKHAAPPAAAEAPAAAAPYLSAGVAARLRKALETQVTVVLDDHDLSKAVGLVRDVSRGLHIHLNAPDGITTGTALRLNGEVPLGAVFQYLEDAYHVRCVAREYGVVIAPADRVPPGAVGVLDLWKSGRPADAGPYAPMGPGGPMPTPPRSK